MTDRFCHQVVEILRAAGWFEGRDVTVFDNAQSPVTLFPEAQKVLKEFGGLHMGSCGAGIDFAKSDVNIDPSLAAYLKPELQGYEESLGMKLFALGEYHNGHGYLVIDEKGGIYLLSDVLEPFASPFSQAIEMLLLGKNTPSGEALPPTRQT